MLDDSKIRLHCSRAGQWFEDKSSYPGHTSGHMALDAGRKNLGPSRIGEIRFGAALWRGSIGRFRVVATGKSPQYGGKSEGYARKETRWTSSPTSRTSVAHIRPPIAHNGARFMRLDRVAPSSREKQEQPRGPFVTRTAR